MVVLLKISEGGGDDKKLNGLPLTLPLSSSQDFEFKNLLLFQSFFNSLNTWVRSLDGMEFKTLKKQSQTCLYTIHVCVFRCGRFKCSNFIHLF
jgi:hypothetical protein